MIENLQTGDEFEPKIIHQIQLFLQVEPAGDPELTVGEFISQPVQEHLRVSQQGVEVAAGENWFLKSREMLLFFCVFCVHFIRA